MNAIGTLNEKPLHASLKQWYAQPGDRFEVGTDGYCIDIVRGDLLIEIQTKGLAALRKKLTALLERHPVRLVYPIAVEKWIVMRDAAGAVLRRRKSPKRGIAEDLFSELVSIPALLANPNFSLDILLIDEEETREERAPRRRWMKPWIRDGRRLIDVRENRLISSPEELAAFLPAALPRRFTTRDIAAAARIPRWLAQKMAYCLRALRTIRQTGKVGNAIIYARVMPALTR